MLMGTRSYIDILKFPGSYMYYCFCYSVIMLCVIFNYIFRGIRDSYYKGMFFANNEEVDHHLELVNYHDESVSHIFYVFVDNFVNPA